MLMFCLPHTVWGAAVPRIFAIGEPGAVWVYGSGVLILLVSYGRTVRRGRAASAPETRIMPSASKRKLNTSAP
jgi:hypothetical protein